MKVIDTNDKKFEHDVLENEKPVLVQFWADWCGPCKMIKPIVDELAEELTETMDFVRINIDESQLTPPKYGIRGIPTLMIFQSGNVIASKVGSCSKSQLRAFIDTSI